MFCYQNLRLGLNLSINLALIPKILSRPDVAKIGKIFHFLFGPVGRDRWKDPVCPVLSLTWYEQSMYNATGKIFIVITNITWSYYNLNVWRHIPPYSNKTPLSFITDLIIKTKHLCGLFLPSWHSRNAPQDLGFLQSLDVEISSGVICHQLWMQNRVNIMNNTSNVYKSTLTVIYIFYLFKSSSTSNHNTIIHIYEICDRTWTM